MKVLILLLTFCGIICVQSEKNKITPYVISGVRSPVAPYFAYIRFFQGRNSAWGGGALVSNQHILTTATVVAPWDSIQVYLGGNNREMMRQHEVSGITAHPDFDRNSRRFDIAVVRLVTAIIPSAEVHPIALPPMFTPANFDLPFEHEEIYIDGLGMTTANVQQPSNFLYRSFQRITSEERCRRFFVVDTDQAFCAEDREERSNVCFGDLGSPAIGMYRRQPYLTGLVRIHSSTCGSNQPAALTRVSFFLPWIQSQLV